MNFYKIAIITCILVFNGWLIIGRSILLYKNTGINPFDKMGKDDAIGFNEKVLVFGASLLPVVAIMFVFFENIYRYFMPIEFLEINFLKNIGCVLAYGGLAVAMIGQLQMGNAWRTGIDKNIKTELVTTGLFRYSRNPIYLALLIFLLGFFLIAPNVISLCALVLAYPTVEMKIRFEEEHLEKMHREEFLKYRKRIRRWV